MLEHFLEECVTDTDTQAAHGDSAGFNLLLERIFDITLSAASWQELLRPTGRFDPERWFPLCFAPGINSTYLRVQLEFTGKPYPDGNEEHLFVVSNGKGQIESVYQLVMLNYDQASMIEYSPAGFTNKFKATLDEALKAARNGGLKRTVYNKF